MAYVKKTEVETATAEEAPATVSIFLPLLEEEGSEKIDQTVSITVNGKAHLIRRGEHVDIPPEWYMILKETGRFPGL